MDQVQIFERLEERLLNYVKFEEMVIAHIRNQYFPLVYQSLYNQLGYENFEIKKFTTTDFKNFLIENNFLDLVNEVYRTRLSNKGVKILNNRLQKVNDFDDYKSVLSVFEKCNPRKYKSGNEVCASAWSLGTKILHFYNPEENPILDSVVRENLGISDMDSKLCIEFQKASNKFVNEHSEYFDEFYKSARIKKELKKRYMTNNFPIMEILDMALYEPDN